MNHEKNIYQLFFGDTAKVSSVGSSFRYGTLFMVLITISVKDTFAQQAPIKRPVQNEHRTTVFPEKDTFKNSKITFQLVSSVNNTWGYQILADNKVMIKQSCIPGVTGNEGFATKKGAEDVAKLVIYKMKKGEMPPSVTIDEMKKIKAI